ncbi:hypothetical protein [Rhodanobacter denitrificans]|uniref:hypothetical protein n=1 Tax=Rhodanobacter denitrificans TaxID=666685 RepID=UPI0011C0757A|nr:hypothetical protein [Rhodanobacter denitrificans]
MKNFFAILVTCLLLMGCQSHQQAAESVSPPPTTQAAAPIAASAPKPQPSSWVGPFGIQMGLTKQQVLDATGAQALPDNPFTYVSSKAPKGHVAFQNYAYTIGDQSGLCSVVGLGDEFDADAYGNAVRSNFSTIEGALTKKYGEPTSTDKDLATGSIWSEPKDWMMGLLKNERPYRVDWNSSSAHPLPDHLALIRLNARATSSDKAALAILYRFDNADACDKEVAAKRDASL